MNKKGKVIKGTESCLSELTPLSIIISTQPARMYNIFNCITARHGVSKYTLYDHRSPTVSTPYQQTSFGVRQPSSAPSREWSTTPTHIKLSTLSDASNVQHTSVFQIWRKVSRR